MDQSTQTSQAPQGGTTHTACECSQEEFNKTVDALNKAAVINGCSDPAEIPDPIFGNFTTGNDDTQRDVKRALSLDQILGELGLERVPEPSPEQEREALNSAIVATKGFRVLLDHTLQEMKSSGAIERISTADIIVGNIRINSSIEQHVLAVRDLESAIMRLGMVLKGMRTENPYPNSYNPPTPEDQAMLDRVTERLKRL